MYDVPIIQSNNAKTDADIATKNTEANRNPINTAIAVEIRSFISSPLRHGINDHQQPDYAYAYAHGEADCEGQKQSLDSPCREVAHFTKLLKHIITS